MDPNYLIIQRNHSYSSFLIYQFILTNLLLILEIDNMTYFNDKLHTDYEIVLDFSLRDDN